MIIQITKEILNSFDIFDMTKNFSNQNELIAYYKNFISI